MIGTCSNVTNSELSLVFMEAYMRTFAGEANSPRCELHIGVLTDDRIYDVEMWMLIG